MRHRGLTLIETIIVIGIIALLFAIAVPVFNGVIGESRQAVSAANLRQWGTATTNFLNDNEQRLPWEGLLADESNAMADMQTNFEEPDWWANALPEYMGEDPYRVISQNAVDQSESVPIPPRKSVFVDPQADGRQYGESPYPFYFSYAFNSGLHASMDAVYAAPTSLEEEKQQRLQAAQVTKPAITVLMFEMRGENPSSGNNPLVPNHITTQTPYYADLECQRHRATWDRMTSRHDGGGQVVFMDGSVKWFDLARVLTNDQGTILETATNADWNKPDIIWNPLDKAVPSLN